MARQVLIISPTGREYRALPAVAQALDCQLLFDDFAGSFFDDVLGHHASAPAPDINALLEAAIARHTGRGLAGVTTGVGYPGMPVAAIMAARLGLTGPRVASVLLCEQKYHARRAQRELVPQATPMFGLLTPERPQLPAGLRYPVFVKPVKSCFSMGAQMVETEAELHALVHTGALPAPFLEPFADLLGRYTDLAADAASFLAEAPLAGAQVSFEGYVFAGRVHTLGVIDALMYPGTISFRRFQYPSQLSPDVQQRMAQLAAAFIGGIGYDNAMFNVEFIYNQATDEIHIVEVNPKIASQFTDLFEQVDGASSYRPLLQIALGVEPDWPRGRGPFKVAASCVMRTFTDGRVLRVPSAAEVAALQVRFPDARVEVSVQPGQLLSDVMQDGKSYRYCVINIGADSPAALDEKFAACAAALAFEFGPA